MPVTLPLLVLALLQPPAPPDSLSYVVLNHGRPAGEMIVVTRGDSVLVRYHHVDRNRGPRTETRYRVGRGGALLGMESRGMNPTSASQAQPVSERMEVRGGRVRWTTAADSGDARATPDAIYRARSTTPFDDALLAGWLLSRPRHAAALLPGGEARAEVVLDTTLSRADGARERVRLVFVDEGSNGSPGSTWLDARGMPFASGAEWFITVRRGWEDALPALRRAEIAARGARSAALARRLAPAPARAIVIRNGDVFDSERAVVRPRTTVVVEGDRIVAVGPADSVRTPDGATVIDATGKTVIPGLWDMHTHLFQTAEVEAAMHLAAGVTTVRDMASDLDAAVSFRARSDSGTLVGPRFLLAGFIEGPGAWAGPSEALVRTEAEARAWVARYDSLGFRQVKLYNLVHPDLVPTIVEEARRRGLRVSGHVPRGLTTQTAVQLGFDEIQHAAFLLSTFHQDSLYLPRMRAYSAVAHAVAPTFDVDGKAMTDLIALLKAKGTVIDGTFNVYQSRGRTLADGTDALYGPAIQWMTPTAKRGWTFPSPSGPNALAREDSVARTFDRVIKRLYDAGVTLVPGTDNLSGFALHGELEVYERAGIPAAQVLRIATWVPAQVMGDTARYGSIAVGKVADIAIVDGRPAERIRDIRRVERVLRAGRLYSSRDLYVAAGFNPPPARVAGREPPRGGAR